MPYHCACSVRHVSGGQGPDIILHNNLGPGLHQLHFREHLQNQRRQRRLLFVHDVRCGQKRVIRLHPNPGPSLHGVRFRTVPTEHRAKLLHRLPDVHRGPGRDVTLHANPDSRLQ